MISQNNTFEAKEESKVGGELDAPKLNLRQSLNRLSILLDTSKTFDQLQSDVSHVLTAEPSVAAVFYLELSANEPDFALSGSNVSQIPDNVKQWAANVAISCCTTDQTRLEQSEDASGSVMQMVAVPVAQRAPQTAIAVLFLGQEVQENRLIFVERAANCLAQWRSNDQLALMTHAAEDLAAQDQLIATVEAAGSLDSACHRIVNELSAYLEILNSTPQPAGGVVVYVGTTQEKGPLRLNAVSNANTLPAAEVQESIEAAMQECLCRNTASSWPRGEENPAGVLCLKRMSHVVGSPYVTAYPIHGTQEKAAGVVVVASGQPLTPRSFAFGDSCSARLGSAMQLVKRAEPGRFQGLVDKIADIKNNRKKWALIGFALLAASLIPMPYQVSSECEVRPESKLFIASPFDTTLEKCHVLPGEQVTKNMLLATLDGRETKLELAEVEAELNRATKQRDGHVVSHESGQAYVAKYEIERLESRRSLLLHRQESLELRSPMDGIVIAGDLQNAEGMPLKVGETLFEVAPLEQLRIELAIPEDDVRYTQPEMQTRIRLDAFPFESWDGKIERVHPASELKNDQNVFVAVVPIENADGRLRPGMTGYAKTETIWRPILWNYFHKPAAATARWFGW
jgi:hypothetical protein